MGLGAARCYSRTENPSLLLNAGSSGRAGISVPGTHGAQSTPCSGFGTGNAVLCLVVLCLAAVFSPALGAARCCARPFKIRKVFELTLALVRRGKRTEG